MVLPALSAARARRSYSPSGVAFVAVFQLQLHGEAATVQAVRPGVRGAADPVLVGHRGHARAGVGRRAGQRQFHGGAQVLAGIGHLECARRDRVQDGGGVGRVAGQSRGCRPGRPRSCRRRSFLRRRRRVAEAARGSAAGVGGRLDVAARARRTSPQLDRCQTRAAAVVGGGVGDDHSSGGAVRGGAGRRRWARSCRVCSWWWHPAWPARPRRCRPCRWPPCRSCRCRCPRSGCSEKLPERAAAGVGRHLRVAGLSRAPSRTGRLCARPDPPPCRRRCRTPRPARTWPTRARWLSRSARSCRAAWWRRVWPVLAWTLPALSVAIV